MIGGALYQLTLNIAISRASVNGFPIIFLLPPNIVNHVLAS
jgi:hypothetical protein